MSALQHSTTEAPLTFRLGRVCGQFVAQRGLITTACLRQCDFFALTPLGVRVLCTLLFVSVADSREILPQLDQNSGSLI